jgi:hypothetical protein
MPPLERSLFLEESHGKDKIVSMSFVLETVSLIENQTGKTD